MTPFWILRVASFQGLPLFSQLEALHHQYLVSCQGSEAPS